MKKTIFITFLICCLLFQNTLSLHVVFADEFVEDEPFIDVFSDNGIDSAGKEPPAIEAGAAVAIDMKSGRILYEKDAFTKRAMASTTKIMTAIIAIENGGLDDEVTVSERAAGIWGSTIDLRPGQKLRLEELLYGLMLNSGNDAAIAIAEHIGGTLENFVGMMNAKADVLDARDTCFQSPHGLDMTDHYSTAYDLAVITRYALNNPVFSKIVKTLSASIQHMSLYNTNEMLEIYPGADGVKTGYTGKAGRCLVASATRDGWRVISVVLNCSDRYARARSAKKILDYAFNNYKPCTLVKSGEEVVRLPVIKGLEDVVPVRSIDEISMPLKSDEADTLESEVNLPGSLPAPVSEGVEVGNIRYLVNGKVIARSALETGSDVPRKGFIYYMGEIFRSWRRMRFL